MNNSNSRANDSFPAKSTPVPDPTQLTTDALNREVHALKELMTARMDAMDKETLKLHEEILRKPMEVEKGIDNLRELLSERFHVVKEQFNSVQTQFRERDTRSERESKDNKTAVDAALSAQKESAISQNQSNTVAVTKTETSITKQIDGISELIRTTAAGWDRQMGDMKERVTRIESEYVGRSKEVVQHGEQVIQKQGSDKNVIALISMVGGIVFAIVGAVLTFMR